MKVPALLFCLAVSLTSAFSQQDSVKSYTTSFLKGEPPRIDGLADDAAWEQVSWGGGDFTQTSPDAGASPSVQTKFKILYDAKNLYIIFLNLDPEPDKIVRRMSRRDGFEGDFVEVNIDSYYDKRTAFSFTASVSGVKGDEYVSNNGNNWDANWDPIWYLKTSLTTDGWIAEMRIPLSQLRFADKPEHVWGLQVTRLFFRNQERSTWQYIPPDAAGWVHLFGELKGITGIRPQKQLEIQPYVVASTERYEKEENNPFLTGTSTGTEFGLDAKIGITSDITLDLTVNPDFGQVEADPSQVNLSAFQLFFQERRPFFIEGNNTLNFPVVDWENNNLFYSRRVGRRPQGWVDTDPDDEDDGVDEYVKPNHNTTILGAAKLTGKNKKGFSWGLLESVTAREESEVDSLGYRRSQVIEPMTNYLVARAQQDINKGNTVVGGMFTATNRNLDDDHLNWLRKDAYSGGVDIMHSWKDRKYFINARALFSHVRGSEEAITQTQESSERYFQRPDNGHADVDTTRTSLTGTGGLFMIGKRSGKLVYEVGYTWLSPELELNDAGFLTQTDVMTQWTWAQYRVLNPVGIFRTQQYSVVQYLGWDFDGKNTSGGYDADTYLEFKNFWSVSSGIMFGRRNVSNADLRGGPAFHYPGSFDYWLTARTDRRKKFQVIVNPQWSWGFNNFRQRRSLGLVFNYRPINALSVSVEPSFTRFNNKVQYVASEKNGSGDRFVVGELDQTITRVSIRMTYMITPNLSVQYWGQPFGSSGSYTNFKYVTDADANQYEARFADISVARLSLNEDDDEYVVDEDDDGAVDYTFENPNFNFGQFRSNFVVRWEYIPGSTFFLVWTQEMNGEFFDRPGPVHKKYDFNFEDKAHNIFLLKFTYRFVL